MRKLNRRCNEFFNIAPETFLLPKEYINFIQVFQDKAEVYKEQNFWIMKPVGKSRGRGIFLVNDLTQVAYSEQMIVQQYVLRPLLLDGHKFDLRLYVLVTQFQPKLEAFIYKEGFARMSTVPYTLNPSDIGNRFIHLTNTSIQKHSKDVDSKHLDYLYGGSKLSLKQLKPRLAFRRISFESL